MDCAIEERFSKSLLGTIGKLVESKESIDMMLIRICSSYLLSLENNLTWVMRSVVLYYRFEVRKTSFQCGIRQLQMVGSISR